MSTMTIDPLTHPGPFRVKGRPGVAYRILEPVTVAQETTELICEDDEHEHDESCYLTDSDIVDDPDLVVIRAIGDDHRDIASREDLEPLEDGDHCRICGQTGCPCEG